MVLATLSIVVPTYTITSALADLALRCVLSYRGHYDELIVSEDGGTLEGGMPELMALASIYVRSQDNQGFTRTVNNGWRVARGDYVAIVNSDTRLVSGDLYDLCIPGKVTSPIFTDNVGRPPFLHGAFFVVPRSVFEERGLLDERFRMYYSDTDYALRTKDIFKLVTSVTIDHVGKVTTNAAGVTHAKDTVPDQKRFAEKQ